MSVLRSEKMAQDSIETFPVKNSDIWTREYMDTSNLPESDRPRKD